MARNGNRGQYVASDLNEDKWTKMSYRFPDASKENVAGGVSKKHAFGDSVIRQVRFAIQAIPPEIDESRSTDTLYVQECIH
jgi:hypothetical protein